MSSDPISSALELLLSEHRPDTDGGDQLVRAIIRHARGLMPGDRELLHAQLLEFVDVQRPGVWHVALEVLVRTGNAATGRALVPMLTARERTSEWSDAVVLAMLRLGCSNALGMCREYVREELRLHHLGALPMLAWLYRTDLDFALPLAAQFYAGALGSGAPANDRLRDGLARQLPGQLDGLLATSTATVLDLLDRTAALDAAASAQLARLMRGYLASPDARSELGPRAVDSLGEAIRMRAA